MLEKMDFKEDFIKWIQVCITTSSFATITNTHLSNIFGSLRGLRQGDPLSPKLFVIGMEGLTSIFDYTEFEGKVKGLDYGPSKINPLFFCK